MGFLSEIGDSSSKVTSVEKVGVLAQTKDEFSIIPPLGVFLGLDISECSSGVCLYENGKKFLWNIFLVSTEGDYYEVRLRRELKDCLREVVEGKEFDIIVIEDAFQGVNPMVTRKLYAINTAIDELVLDGICKCKYFLRVNNQVWKSWLFKLDEEGIYKGLDDKKRIQKCLEMVGIYEDDSDGYQDRLDATGLLVSFFLNEGRAKRYKLVKGTRKVSFSDVDFSYEEAEELCLFAAGYGQREIKSLIIDDKTVNKKMIVEYLSMDPDIVFITSRKLSLGIFGDTLGLQAIRGGGHFAFWVKPKRLKKYLKEE